MCFIYKSVSVTPTLFEPDVASPLDKALNEGATDGWEAMQITPFKEGSVLVVTFRKPA